MIFFLTTFNSVTNTRSIQQTPMLHGCTIANLNITINKLKCVKLCDLKTLDVTGPYHEIKRDAYFDVIVEGMSEVLKGTFRNTKN